MKSEEVSSLVNGLTIRELTVTNKSKVIKHQLLGLLLHCRLARSLCELQFIEWCSRQVSDEVLTVRHFQLASWPESSDYPAGLDVIIDLMETVEKWQQASGNSSITVHCMYVCGVKQLCVFHWTYKCMY